MTKKPHRGAYRRKSPAHHTSEEPEEDLHMAEDEDTVEHETEPAVAEAPQEEPKSLADRLSELAQELELKAQHNAPVGLEFARRFAALVAEHRGEHHDAVDE
jgi:hypothetical protein